MSLIWNQLLSIFEDDDGSLPDIFIEELTGEQVVEIYRKTMLAARVYGSPTAWSISEQRDVQILELDSPAELVVKGEIEPFRHGLEDFKINNVPLPEITVCVDKNSVSFDYRAGSHWGAKEVEQLFAFLWYLVRNVPNARVFHAYEGCSHQPTELFARNWNDYVLARTR